MTVMAKKKPKKRRKGMSAQAMKREAARIVNSDDMIRGVNKSTWRIRSRSSRRKWHTVKMSENGLECSCDYCQKRDGAVCVHGKAIEILILQKAFKMKPGGKKVVIGEKDDEIQCPNGHTGRISCNGKRPRVYRETAQLYTCGECGARFTHDIGFAGRHYPPEAILLALSLFAVGNAPASISLVIWQHMSLKIHPDTIQRWADYYIALVEMYTNGLPIRTGGKWSVDEKHLEIKKETHWLFTMLDEYSRFLLAWNLADKKDGYNASKLFRASVDRAGCTPAILTSDSLKSFKSACNAVYRTAYGSCVLHWCDCHLRDLFRHNNGQERANSTFDELIRIKRSIKSADSIIIRAALLHYNFCRPHSGINGRTPAAAANIIIKGNNPWKTLIHNAVLVALSKT